MTEATTTDEIIGMADLEPFIKQFKCDEQKLKNIRLAFEQLINRFDSISHDEVRRIIYRYNELLQKKICFSSSDALSIGMDVISEMRQKPTLRLDDFSTTGYSATLGLIFEGQKISCTAVGNGMIHAIVNCFRKKFPDLRLQIHRCTCLSSNDNGMLHHVFVRLLLNYREGEADTIETDLILATIRAIIKALNKTL